MEEVRVCEWKGWRSASASLRQWRGAGEKRSDLVLQLGARMLRDHSSALGPECKRPSVQCMSLVYVHMSSSVGRPRAGVCSGYGLC